MDLTQNHVPDRLYVAKDKIDLIRKIKDEQYFFFDKHKDVFLFAMSLGADLYTRGEQLSSSKEGLFLEKDLSDIDKAYMYAIVSQALDDIQDITNTNKVYEIAEIMADKGLDILFDKIKTSSSDIFILQAIKRANQLYDEAESKSLFLNR